MLGEGAETQHLRYIKLFNDCVADRPSDMAICTHLCRGNYKSGWMAEGSYDHVAEALFSELDVDGFFLEYDDERSGGFEPLRFLPKGKMVVLGLVTTKSGKLESKDELKRRIDAGGEICAARSALPVAAMRLRLHRRGQPAHHRRAICQARADRRDRARGLGDRMSERLRRGRGCGCRPGRAGRPR